MKYSVFLLVFGLFFMPVATHAETVLRIGEGIAVEEDQTVKGDYYVSVGPFGDTTMSGVVEGDMYAFGGSVTVNGEIHNDLSIAGVSSDIHATVTDDVRIVGGDVTIAEHIGGDLFVIGANLKMLSTASVDGDIIFFGGDAEINGTVGGSVLGTSKKIRIDGEVRKDVNIKTATQLTLGSRANIAGSVRYASLEPLVRAQSANVGKEVSQNEYYIKPFDAKERARDAFIPFLITLFATLSFYMLFKKELQALVWGIHKAPLKNALFGVSVLVLGPVVSLMLMATVIGLLLGIFAAGLVIVAYAAGFALSGVILGSYITKAFTKHAQVNLLSVCLGTAVMHALLFVPVVGVVVLLGAFVLAVGGMTSSAYKLLS